MLFLPCSPKFFDPDPDKLFAGMIVTTTHIPRNDRDIIAAAVEHFGGRFQNVLTKEVTHLIALRPEGVRISTLYHADLMS